MSKIDHNKDFVDALWGYVTASSGFLVFGADLMKALLLGIFGAVGSLITKWFYYKYLKKDGDKNKKGY